MPLSEEEQKVLEEIERNFYEHDPALANTVRSTTVYRDSGRRAIVGVIGVVVGLVLIVIGLSQHFVLSYVGFVVTLAGGLVLERYMRRIGKAGMRALTGRLREGAVGQPSTQRQLRTRPEFRRPGRKPNDPNTPDADTTDQP